MLKKLFIFISIVLLSHPLRAKTIVVDQTGDGDYIQINQAITNSTDGDTIFVKAGIYVESVKIYRAITIIGEDPEATIIVHVDYSVEFMNDLGSTLVNFTIKNNGNIAILCGRFKDQNNNGTLRNCIIENCTGLYTVEVQYSSALSIENCIIRNNEPGINLNGGNINIVNCIIHDNLNSLIRIEGGHATIQNSIIVNNNGYIAEAFKSYVTNLYNCIWNSGTGTGLGEINQDPKLQNLSAFDYRLQEGSLCLDAGNPSPQYNDPNGTRNDMGVHGGPHSWRGLGPIITNLEVTPQSVIQGETINISATATLE